MRFVGPGIFFFAVGAILKFAVTYHHKGFNLGTIGIILMVAGAVGVLIGIAFSATRRRTDVVHSADRTTVVEPRDPNAY